MDEFDLIVIGAGRSGLEAARTGLALGAKVALVARDGVGGRHWHHRAAALAFGEVGRSVAAVRRASNNGLDRIEATFRYARVAERVRAALEPGPSVAPGVTLIDGVGAFREPGVLVVDGRVLRAKRFVLATGSRPDPPDIEGLSEVEPVTVPELAQMRRLPRSLLMVGSRQVHLVAAQALARLGCPTTLVVGDGDAMGGLHRDCAAELDGLLVADGVSMASAARVRKVGPHPQGVAAELEDAGGPRQLYAERLLVAPTLIPDVDALEAFRAKIESSGWGVHVDEHLRTSQRGVWAVGGGRGEPCPLAEGLRQARLAARAAVSGVSGRFDPQHVAAIVPTDPPVGCVGESFSEARSRGLDLVTGRALLADGFVELAADREGALLGAIAVGEQAPHLLAVVAQALAAHHDAESLLAELIQGGEAEAPLAAAATWLLRQRRLSVLGRARRRFGRRG